MADISVIIVSHNKPTLVKEAVQSVLDQTFLNWEAVLMDSGVLLNQGFFSYLKDPRFRILPTHETPEMARTKSMACWCFNRILVSGMLTGELILYLCDDDYFYPNGFATFWNYYSAHQRIPQAMYASEDAGFLTSRGRTIILGTRHADQPAGTFCQGRKLDYEADYLQFGHTAKVLKNYTEVYQTTEFFSEDRKDAAHADGIFMERIGALTKVWNIDEVIGVNRRTRDSINYPPTPWTFVRTFLHFKLAALKHCLNRRRTLPPA